MKKLITGLLAMLLTIAVMSCSDDNATKSDTGTTVEAGIDAGLDATTTVGVSEDIGPAAHDASQEAVVGDAASE